jgi:hypothetical protein
MRRRKKLMTELGFLRSPNMLYLYVHTNGPLQRQGPKIYVRALIFCLAQTIKEASAYQEKWYEQKKRGERKKSHLSRSTAYLVLDSGA